MESGKITPALPQDAVALTEVLRAAYAPYAKQIKDLPDMTAGLDQDLERDEGWMIETDSGPVAFMLLHRQMPYLRVVNLAVHPDWAGKGLARKLMDHAVERATDQDLRELVLTTHAQMHDNIRIYKKMGWHIVERRARALSMARVLR